MITNYCSDKVLTAMCGKANTISIAPKAYLALSSTLPTKAGGNITEPSGGGYARVMIGDSQYSFTQMMGAPNAGEIFNTQEIHFNEATASWGQQAYGCIFDAPSGGNLIACGELGDYVGETWTPQPITPLANTVVVIKTGCLKISIV